ncbi:hypothetical protein MRB53_013384 [Persea americana]|uniref:Uncharacterized protein n=1 Tax=Persea americana TaxID=3435 RepID=A0ACC2K7T4_PERAE|nr:hypothetical protein MRB53_013384 [Persea americana]
MEPPISNALMAALKRAQAHQRRGCPEQQQQPLLAVKVELEQLIVSILDDPSVSRVMREASFSSPAVKATIEQSLNSSNSMNSGGIGAGLAFRPSPPINRNVYLNPRLQQQGSCETSGQQRREEVKRVIDILLRSRKRNPVLVGDTEPEVVMRELLHRIEKREVNEGLLHSVQVVSLEKEFGSNRSQIPEKMKELGDLIETRINSSAIACSSSGVILDLGDLKWLVEQQQTGIIGVSGSGSIQHQVVSETRRAAVSEMGKLLARFREGTGDSRLWLIGTATCETYLRCQVYHPTMENEWDLQAVPITARLPMPGLFPRLGGNGILSSSIGSLTPPLKGISMGGAALAPRRQPENTEQTRGSTACCPICMENYEQELAKLVAKEYEKSSSDSKPEVHQALPQWMQTAKLNNGSTKPTDQQQTRDQELVYKQKTEELMKKWNETCRRLHPSFHLAAGLERPPALSITSMCNPNLLGRQSLQPKLPHLRNLPTLQMNPNTLPNPSESPTTAPGSPVATELVLGCPKVQENCMEKTCQERIRDPTGCIPFIWPDKISNRPNDKHTTVLDADSFKRLFKGLTEKVGWQTDAASAVASTIVQTKSGNGKRRGNGAKGDAWLLFVGPDKVGKRKMAMALSELVCGASPITIRLGSRTDDYDEESEVTFRGKTVLDRIAEAVCRNPFSVIVLEDIDRADMLVHGSIKRAMERGRLPDSHGREIALGSVIFVLTTNWLPDNLKSIPDTEVLQEQKLAAAAGQKWQLHISLDGKMSKRRAEWSCDNSDRLTKPRTDAGPGLSFDLNLAADVVEDDAAENSSDLTVEHGHDLSHGHGHGQTNKLLPPSISPNELLNWADDMVVFKPVDFTPLRTKVATTVAAKFAGVIGDRWSIEVDNEALEKIVGGAWFGQTRFEEWVDRVLVPGFQQLKGEGIVPEDGSTVVRLLPMKDGHSAVSEGRHGVVVEGLRGRV